MEDLERGEVPKSVGIMTFHWAHNYGAILQAYGLSHYLKKNFLVNVQIIDFITKRQENVNSILPKIVFDKNIVKSVGHFFLKILLLKPLTIRKIRFQKFSKLFFSFTPHYSNCDEIRNAPPSLDLVITGSDQVFNYRILPDDELKAYFLAPFTSRNTRKIAYAPSFGRAEVPESVRITMIAYLKDFSSLSAREQDGALLLQDMTGDTVPTVVDPVLLLDAEEWKEIARPNEKIKTPYILCYALNGRHFLGEMAARIKKLTGLQVVLMTSKVLTGIKSDITVYNAGPQEFLWLLSNASYIVSDSFHGMVFSTIFEKNFYVQIATPQGAERIKNYLQFLSLEARVVSEVEQIEEDSLSIDYADKIDVLASLKVKSKEYLLTALS